VRLLSTPVSRITAEVVIPSRLELPSYERPVMGQPPPPSPARLPDIPQWTAQLAIRQPAAADPDAPDRNGLRRRQPGPARPADPPAAATMTRPIRHVAADPDAERAALDAFAAGTAQADAERTRAAADDPSSRDPVARPPGLRRRQRGQHLVPDLRESPGRHRTQRVSPPGDPVAERDQLNGYLEAVARAGDPTGTRPWPATPNDWSRR
jgi:hypothetical protein